jgi:hypothetical protein
MPSSSCRSFDHGSSFTAPESISAARRSRSRQVRIRGPARAGEAPKKRPFARPTRAPSRSPISPPASHASRTKLYGTLTVLRRERLGGLLNYYHRDAA